MLRPLLQWQKPQRRGKGISVSPLRLNRYENLTVGEGPQAVTVKSLGAAVREFLHTTGAVNWRGLEVRTIEDLVALGQIARSTSLEHAAFIVVHQGKIVGQPIQVGSLAPILVSWGLETEYKQLINDELDRLEALGYERKALKIVDLHTHTTGDATPSKPDLEHSKFLEDLLGDQYLGAVVIDHEHGVVIRKDGTYYFVKRADDYIDPDPLLQDEYATADYWGPVNPDREAVYKGRYSINADNLHELGQDLLASGWAGSRTTDPMIVLADARARIRHIFNIPRAVFLNPTPFLSTLGAAGRAAGAGYAMAIWEGRDPQLMAVAALYQKLDHLADAIGIAPGVPFALESAYRLTGHWPKGIPWETMNTRVDAPWMPKTYVYGRSDPFSPASPPPDRAPGNRAGDGQPPPAPPRRPFNNGAPDDPDDSWWKRRVVFARVGRAAGSLRRTPSSTRAPSGTPSSWGPTPSSAAPATSPPGSAG